MPEPQPHPASQGDLIASCEGCRNLIHIPQRHVGEVFPCPICGCLNSGEEPSKLISGRIILRGPLVKAEREAVEAGRLALPDLPQKVQESLLWLQEQGWQFGFTAEAAPDGAGDGD